MKFATLALIGAVVADGPIETEVNRQYDQYERNMPDQVEIPTFSWNKGAINSAKNETISWAHRHHDAAQADRKANVRSLSHAYSTYRVQEYVNFGKMLKPTAEFHVQFLDAITPNAQCNQDAATNCLNNFILHGAKPEDRPALKACFRAAHCEPNWDDMTPTQRQALADKYKTSQDTIRKAYQKIWQKTQADLEQGIQAHKTRVRAMKADFKGSAANVAEDLGCDKVCFNTCIDHNQSGDIPRCLKRCHCGQGVIEITETPVNMVAVVEKEYGDVENLSEEDINTISESIDLM